MTENQPAVQSEPKADSTGHSRYAALPVALLLFGVLTQAVLLYHATSDDGFAVEENYYAKAVNYDAIMEQRERNADLGWRLNLDHRGERFQAKLTDATGKPLSGARVAITARHNAHASEVQTAVLSEDTAQGRYLTPLNLDRKGIWEIRATVDRGTERFTSTQRLTVGEAR